ncbi:MAG: NrfD/PsrC family molybdoenzyme membrane anchor subunit [Marinilabiliaceae bacterium]|jgi:molybdopterin-containing oxidoreductase family membrane subunit|nr:NrfD/PsrC family molybdoenzyme membrane anchor subunit [Marinilabiliaceae bacterium]
MEITNKSLIRDLTSEIEGTSKRWYIIFAILVIIFGIGIYALVLQIDKGHIVTGMRDNVVWGLYIVNFIFFMGLSYAGALISGTLHLFKAKWRAPVMRFAELITVIALCIGPFFIFFCIGRLDRLYILFTHPRIQSPITWDVVAIITDLVGCFVFLYLSFIEDFAILRDSKDVKMKAWKRKIFKWLAIGYQGTQKQYIILKRARDIMAAMIIAIAIIVYSVLAWIFGVTLQPGWHSTIFGPYFVIAAVFSGAGLLIVLMQIFRKIYKLEKYITLKHFVNVGYILGIIAAFYGYFTFSDYLTKWYGSVKMDKILIDKLFEDYYFLFILANYVGILVPMIIVAFKRFRTIRNIVAAAVIALLGLWINRYIIVVPTLETPFLPIQDSRMDFVKYAPTWVEWALTAAGISVFGIFLMLVSKIAPLISISEMEETHEHNEN